jgi:hypothetical protein
MLALLALSVRPVRSALAAGPDCTVDPGGGGDYTTIQDAVDDTGCTTINVVAGTYTENVVITRSLTLQGAGAASTTIDGVRTSVVISITNGAAPAIDGFTITGGDGSTNNGQGGGISIREATAIIRNNVISDNVASQAITTSGSGGGIYVTNSTSPVLIYSNTIQANLAYSVVLTSPTVAQSGVGGGILIGSASSAVITGNQILSNVAARTNIPGVAWGGGGGISSFGEDITIDGNTIQGNLGNEVGGNGSGGGIALWGGIATVINNDVVQNTATVSGTNATGGGIYASSVQTLTLTDNWVMSNTAGVTLTGSNLFAGGGGVRVQGGSVDNDTVIIEDNHLIGNVAARMMTDSSAGSASYADGGGLNIVTISTTLIINNEVRGNIAVKNLSLSGSGGWGGRPSGGGIHLNHNDRVTLSDNEIRDNVTAVQQTINGVSSTSLGGGITFETVKSITITNNTIDANTAVMTGSLTSAMGENYNASGGGIHIGGFDAISDCATVENNTFSGNMAAATLSISGAGSSGDAEGGGLAVRDITTARIVNNEVHGNIAAETLLVSGGSGGGSSGGGMYLGYSDNVVVSDNDVRDNVAAVRQAADEVTLGSEAGGIALNNLDNATVSNNTVADNTAVVTGSLTSDTGELYFPSGGGISASCWSKPDCSLSFVGNYILNNTTAYSFTISGANAGGQPGGGGFHLGAGAVLLDSNVISGNVAYLGSNVGHGGAIDVNASTVVMSQNYVVGNRSTRSGWYLSAVNIWEGNLTSTNNVFARNTGGALAHGSAFSPTMTFINDTFYDNGRVGVEANRNSTVYVTNTIVYSHVEGLKLGDPGSTLVGDYNLLSNTVNYAGGAAGGLNDIIGQDPLFVNATAGDFHLPSNSPAIDKGNDTVAPADDFDGDQRPSDGDFDGTARADIGADEYWPQTLYLPIILRNVSP